jgi:hypothetical protein
MARPIPTPPPPPRRKRKLLLAFAVGALLVLAYAVGRWTAESTTPPAAPQQEATAANADVPSRLAPLAPNAPAMAPRPAAPQPAPVAQTIAPAPPPPAPSTGPSPAVVARATEEAKANIETLRQQIVSQCWPAGGLKGGRTSAKLVFDVTFDAQGHEIARGLRMDRRAPAGEFARCLSSMPGTSLSISPPGTTVRTGFEVTFP